MRQQVIQKIELSKHQEECLESQYKPEDSDSEFSNVRLLQDKVKRLDKYFTHGPIILDSADAIESK